MSLEGTFVKQEGAPCPRCRNANWVALVPGSGQVECPQCRGVWPTVKEYIASVTAAWGQQYDHQLAAVANSARAYGVYR